MNKKTKIFFFLFLSLLTLKGYSQFNSDYDKKEALEMAAIINSFTFLELYNSDNDIIPKEYKKTYTSAVFGMDNKYQIFTKKNTAVINLRGSTTKKVSWMENIYSSMVPAKGEILIQNELFKYNFSDDKDAAVHAGYTLSIALLSKNIISNIKALNYDDIYNITITGHSQGGALAILLRSYLEHLPKDQISEKNIFKTYVFANPKVGNQIFVNDFVENCKKGTFYSIVNVKDLVPKMPLSPGEHQKMSTLESFSMLFNDKSTSLKDVAFGRLARIFGGKVQGLINFTSGSAFRQITKKVGAIEMPEHAEGAEYVIMKNRVQLIPFIYPKLLKDPTILNNDSLMVYLKKDENGDFIDQSVYKKEPMIFQHKTYNYYTFYMKRYFPKKYENLKLKYLPENL